jgi:hypothetical protein
MLTANDAIEAVGVTDLVLLVARANITTTDRAERSMEILTRLEAPLGGVVLVATDQPTSDYYYYYQRGRLGGKQKRTYTTGAPPAGTNGNGNGHAAGIPNAAPANGSSPVNEPAGEQHPS